MFIVCARKSSLKGQNVTKVGNFRAATDEKIMFTEAFKTVKFDRLGLMCVCKKRYCSEAIDLVQF